MEMHCSGGHKTTHVHQLELSSLKHTEILMHKILKIVSFFKLQTKITLCDLKFVITQFLYITYYTLL